MSTCSGSSVSTVVQSIQGRAAFQGRALASLGSTDLLCQTLYLLQPLPHLHKHFSLSLPALMCFPPSDREAGGGGGGGRMLLMFVCFSAPQVLLMIQSL